MTMETAEAAGAQVVSEGGKEKADGGVGEDNGVIFFRHYEVLWDLDFVFAS